MSVKQTTLDMHVKIVIHSRDVLSESCNRLTRLMYVTKCLKFSLSESFSMFRKFWLKCDNKIISALLRGTSGYRMCSMLFFPFFFAPTRFWNESPRWRYVSMTQVTFFSVVYTTLSLWRCIMAWRATLTCWPTWQATTGRKYQRKSDGPVNKNCFHTMDLAKSFFNVRDHDGYVGRDEHSVSIFESLWRSVAVR